MLLLTLIDIVGSAYPISLKIYNIIGIIIGSMLAYKVVYYTIGLFFTRKFKPAKKKHKYGIVISARNEEKVIGNLLDSIKKQDYPSELLTVFVVADNCTDHTADIVRKSGAICYERFDSEHKTKGFALEFLFDRIEEDYKRDSFEGYFVFDADNLLKKDYISKMNDAFDSGEKIITSYRNTKNFDESWVASTYALHWLRSIRMNHRARSVLRLATNIQGTGFLFDSEIVKNGWHYTSLTEDRALTADAVSQGYEISYQDEAIFYDEQPINLTVALRQRLRWSKGHLLAFKEKGFSLFTNIIFGKLFVKNRWSKESKKKKNFLFCIVESIRHRFASFDTLAQLVPVAVINLFRWLLISVIIYSCYCYKYGIVEMSIFSGESWIFNLLANIFRKSVISVAPGTKAMILSILIAFWLRIIYRIGLYFGNTIIAIYLFIIERKNIKKMKLWKKLLFIITWPTFDIIGRYTVYVAMFVNVTWKPIPHTSQVSIEDIHK